jgi:tetratricopeptide (TPR) repeat protein
MRKVLGSSLLVALILAFGCSKKKQDVREEEKTPPAAEAEGKDAWEGTEGEEAPAEPPMEEAPPMEEPPAEEPPMEEPPAEEPPMEEPPAEEPPMEEPPAEEPPMEEEPPAEEPPMEEPPAMEEPVAPAQPRSPEEVMEGAEMGQERVDTLKRQLRTLGETLYREGNLESAREQYRRILLLDPTDEDARANFQRISQELGERVPTVEEVIDAESNAVKARKDQTVVELNRRLHEARLAEQNGDYDTAIRKYEEMVNILNWYRYQADLPVTTEQARAYLERAKQQRDLEASRRRQKAIAEIQKEQDAARERERTEELRRMKVFLQMANDAYDRGEYELAVENAGKVLRIDPRNESALKLVQIAKETKYVHDRNEMREEFSDQWRSVMEQLERDAIPHPEILNFPANWDEISRRRPKAPGSQAISAPDPRRDQILNALAGTRVFQIDWKPGDVTLSSAIAYLRSVTGLNFILSQKIKEEKADQEIILKVDNVSVQQVLDLITEPNEMAWKVRNGVIMVLAKDEALDRPVLQFYDVKDLVAKIQDFPGQEINLVPSKYQPPEAAEVPEPQSPFEIDSLIEVIKQTIDPPAWELEGVNIEPKNGVLVVRQIPEVHQKIGQFLSDLRKNTGVLVSMEVRFLRAEDRFLRDVGVDIRGLGDDTGGVGAPGLGTGTPFDDSFFGSPANPQNSPPGVIPEPSSIGTRNSPGVFYGDGADGEYKGRVENLLDFALQFDEPGRATASAATGGTRGDNSGGTSVQFVFLDDTQLEVILRAVEKNQRIEEISAPRLTVYDTQRANVSVMTQNSYVQDFDVEIAQAAAIGDPIVQTIRDGIILDVKPIVSADRRFITMELRPTVAELVRPIPTFLTSLATGPPVVIQVPEIAISRVRTTVTMPDGGTLLLGGIKFFKDIQAESGVPILSKIPIVSFLFTRKAKLIQRSNLLILIKALVVIPEEHAGGLGFQ